MQKRVYDLTVKGSNDDSIGARWSEALFKIDDPERVALIIPEMAKRAVKTWQQVLKWASEVKPGADQDFLQPFIKSQNKKFQEPWMVLALIRHFFLAGEWERKYFRKNIKRFFEDGCTDIIVFNKSDLHSGKCEEFMRRIVRGNALCFTHYFMSPQSTERELQLSAWFEWERSRGAIDVSTGVHGIRIRLDFQNREIWIGQTLFTPLTRSVSGAGNLNPIEVAFESLFDAGSQNNLKSQQEVFSQLSLEAVVSEYRRRKEAMVHSRASLISFLFDMMMLNMSPPAFPDKNDDDRPIEISVESISDHLLKVEEGWHDVVEAFINNIPADLSSIFSSERERSLAVLRKLSGLN